MKNKTYHTVGRTLAFLLTSWKYLHDRIISLRWASWAYRSSLALKLFIEAPVLSKGIYILIITWSWSFGSLIYSYLWRGHSGRDHMLVWYILTLTLYKSTVYISDMMSWPQTNPYGLYNYTVSYINEWKTKHTTLSEQLQNLTHIYMTAHFPCLAQELQWIVLSIIKCYERKLKQWWSTIPPISTNLTWNNVT
jgi:hypothetical protein